MNKLSLLCFGMLLLVTACKKTDVLPATAAPVVSAKPAAVSNSWTSLASWQSATIEKTTIYSAKISDSTITASVASNGLVLGFTKADAAIHALPYEQKDGSQTYLWYYQVSQGAIQVRVNVTSGATAPSVANSFTYLVFTPEKVQALIAKGQTKVSLMSLSYENAVALLK